MSELRRHIMMQQGGGGLPVEYQQVEYIKATGTQYILFPCRIIEYNYCRCIYEYETTSCWVVGGWINTTGNGGLDVDSYYGGRYWYGEADSHSKGTSPNTIYDLTIAKSGSMQYSWTEIVMLFGLFYNGAVRNVTGTKSIYYFALLDWNQVPKIELIPCYRKSDNEPGMYDIVNDVFYTNAGSGTFVVGPDVN